MHMDIKKYEVLLRVIDRGSFARACDDLSYTQSGITNMMNSLEKELGFPLLIRNNKGIQMTADGMRVLPAIRELVRVNDRLEQECGLVRGVETGEVRVGTFPTLACAWLPRMIRNFHERYPGISIKLMEENNIFHLEEWLSTGFVDVAFFSRQPKHTYEWIDLKKDPYLAVLPEKSPLAEYDRVPLEELVQTPFLMCQSLDGADQDIDRYLKSNGLRLQYHLTSNSDYTVICLIEEQLGVSILPELFLDLVLKGHPSITVRPLSPPAYRRLGLTARTFRDLSPAASRLVQTALDCFRAEPL